MKKVYISYCVYREKKIDEDEIVSERGDFILIC